MARRPEITNKEIYEKLEEIKTQLDLFISLFKMVNSKVINDMKKEILGVETRKKIYELCDGTKTVTGISNALKQSKQLISYHLSTLESSGFISHKDSKGMRYYYKTLE